MLDIDRASEIIKKHTNKFLNRIKDVTKTVNRPNISSSFIFPALEPADSMYFEYEYYERFLEDGIRIELITGVLTDLIRELGDDSISVEPINSYGTEPYYKNFREIDDFGFEFIIKMGKDRVGFCYSNMFFHSDIRGSFSLYRFIKKNRIKYVYVIEWNDYETSEKKDAYVPKGSRSFGKCITMRRFFKDMFSDDIYEIYYDEITKAIEYANKEVGLKTIPEMSFRYLSDFKDELKILLREIDYRSLKYRVIKDDDKDIVERASKILSEEDCKIIENNFVGCGLYKALIGRCNFAKCFLTSEYMYRIFEKGGSFEYTSIVSGYLKSVEQLMHTLVFNTDFGENRWISRKSKIPDNIPITDIKKHHKTHFPVIKFIEDYTKYFKKDMGSYRVFIEDNKDKWTISNDGVGVVCDYLRNYGDEDRNEHFHRDNITDFDEVKIIRNNTILLLYLLIGGYRFKDSLKEEEEILGIIDDEYDRLYKALQRIHRGSDRFYLQFSGDDEIKAIRMYDQPDVKYDEEGSLAQSVIRFIRVNDFDIGNYWDYIETVGDDQIITLSKNNMPERIWHQKTKKSKRYEISWK